MPTTSLRIWERRWMRSDKLRAAALLIAVVLTGSAVLGAHADTGAAAARTDAAATHGAADTVYRHGRVYTVDAHDTIQEALAIRDGRIVYVGTDAGAAAFTGPKTTV